MPRVTLTHPATRDIDEIWDHIAQDSVRAADRLVDQVYNRCELYATQPESGVPADQFQKGLRYFSIGNYVVFYRPQAEGILVIRVLHGARNLDAFFGGQSE